MDVYTDWCGACTSATGVFQKANVQYNGQPVKFATVRESEDEEHVSIVVHDFSMRLVDLNKVLSLVE